MSVRDWLLNVLIGIGFFGFIAAISNLDTLPFYAAVIIAVLLWVIYIILVIRDHQRDIRYPIIRYRPDETNPRQTPQPIYDQDQKEED